jgi:MFS family permease
MLIKQAAPEGATGRVYGAVYSGLDTGFALAAPVFGWLMDQGRPAAVFGGAAGLLVLGLVSATAVGLGVQRKRQAQCSAAPRTTGAAKG